ncbi:hypothetical protein MRBLMN1_002174 [Chitinophaga ginsengisegetis]|uniref:hypothetical protein n=1 Tax=Chitinophaga ginsengisegetis TaxID=393003 RepID=UPI00342B37D6
MKKLQQPAKNKLLIVKKKVIIKLDQVAANSNRDDFFAAMVNDSFTTDLTITGSLYPL